MPRTEFAFAGPANTGCLPNGRKHWVFTESSCVCLHTVNTDFCVYADLRPGHLHVIFNAAKAGFESAEDWQWLEPAMRSFADFLGHKGFMELFDQSCMQGEPMWVPTSVKLVKPPGVIRVTGVREINAHRANRTHHRPLPPEFNIGTHPSAVGWKPSAK